MGAPHPNGRDQALLALARQRGLLAPGKRSRALALCERLKQSAEAVLGRWLPPPQITTLVHEGGRFRYRCACQNLSLEELAAQGELRCPHCGEPFAAGEPEEAAPDDTVRDPYRGERIVPLPERIGPFEIEHELGRGATGAVYLAKHPRGGPVALKVLRQNVDAESLLRFQREVHLGRNLSHPGIVKVLDTGQDEEGRHYLVMDYVPGKTLRDRLEAEGTLDPEEARRLVREAAEAIAYLHSEDVIHRDLKPENLILDPARNRVRITDLGLARGLEDESYTATGALVGTPHYMAPEQLMGEDLDARADVYALGVILYECLSGKTPFAGLTPLLLAEEVFQGPPPPPRREGVELPPDLVEVCMRALSIKQDERPASAGMFARALRTGLDGGAAPRSRPAAPAKPAPRTAAPVKQTEPEPEESRTAHLLPLLAGMAGTFLLFALGTLIVRGLRSSPPASPPPATPAPSPSGQASLPPPPPTTPPSSPAYSPERVEQAKQALQACLSDYHHRPTGGLEFLNEQQLGPEVALLEQAQPDYPDTYYVAALLAMKRQDPVAARLEMARRLSRDSVLDVPDLITFSALSQVLGFERACSDWLLATSPPRAPLVPWSAVLLSNTPPVLDPAGMAQRLDEFTLLRLTEEEKCFRLLFLGVAEILGDKRKAGVADLRAALPRVKPGAANVVQGWIDGATPNVDALRGLNNPSEAAPQGLLQALQQSRYGAELQRTPDQAATGLEQLARAAPPASSALLEIRAGRLRLRADEQELARACFARAYERASAPGVPPDVRQLSARLLARQLLAVSQDPARAEELAQEAAQPLDGATRGELSDAWVLVGLARVARGDREGAEEALRQAKALRPLDRRQIRELKHALE